MGDETGGHPDRPGLPRYGLAPDTSVKETTLRHLVGGDKIADLIWEAPHDLAAAADNASQSLIAHVSSDPQLAGQQCRQEPGP